MKLAVLSDLHLGVSALDRPATDADAVVLAGDIGRPPHGMSWAAGFGRPVLYVPGNHEYYGGTIEGVTRELRRLCAGTQVRVLADDEVVIGGVRFLGTTLWSDFMLFGPGPQRAAAMEAARRQIRDHAVIRLHDAADGPFSPDDAAALFARHAAWLRERLQARHDGPTVVVTHHAPSPRSIHPRFEGSLLNAAFVSDAESLVGASGAACWIHGHTHDSFDYRVQGTRVVCNPRGYAKDGVNENARFDPGFVIEV